MEVWKYSVNAVHMHDTIETFQFEATLYVTDAGLCLATNEDETLACHYFCHSLGFDSKPTIEVIWKWWKSLTILSTSICRFVGVEIEWQVFFRSESILWRHDDVGCNRRLTVVSHSQSRVPVSTSFVSGPWTTAATSMSISPRHGVWYKYRHRSWCRPTSEPIQEYNCRTVGFVWFAKSIFCRSPQPLVTNCF